MIVVSLTGLSLLVSVATGPIQDPTTSAPSTRSVQQKSTAMQPLVRQATECIARTVVADPRYAAQRTSDGLGDLIVASVPACMGRVRAMIDAYDSHFGQGTGEAFFAGPYLDILPTAISQWVDEIGGEPAR